MVKQKMIPAFHTKSYDKQATPQPKMAEPTNLLRIYGRQSVLEESSNVHYSERNTPTGEREFPGVT